MRFTVFFRIMKASNVGVLLKQMRAFQVTITIFNQSQSQVIFLSKMFLITAAIVMSFFGIQYFRGNWLVGLFDIAVALYAEVSFLALYDHAFAIHLKAYYVCKVAPLKLKNEPGKQCQRLSVLKRELRSFPFMGIQVGKFYYLERDSTPKFFDFVAIMTFNMLITL